MPHHCLLVPSSTYTITLSFIIFMGVIIKLYNALHNALTLSILFITHTFYYTVVSSSERINFISAILISNSC